MTSGFWTVPEELRRAATEIGSVIENVTTLPWHPPSGNYGHNGVQTAWERFIEGMKTTVLTLHGKANEHGENLKAAASSYAEADSETKTQIGELGEAIGTIGTQIIGSVGSSISAILDGESDLGKGAAH